MQREETCKGCGKNGLTLRESVWEYCTKCMRCYVCQKNGLSKGYEQDNDCHAECKPCKVCHENGLLPCELELKPSCHFTCLPCKGCRMNSTHPLFGKVDPYTGFHYACLQRVPCEACGLYNDVEHELGPVNMYTGQHDSCYNDSCYNDSDSDFDPSLLW